MDEQNGKAISDLRISSRGRVGRVGRIGVRLSEDEEDEEDLPGLMDFWMNA